MAVSATEALLRDNVYGVVDYKDGDQPLLSLVVRKRDFIYLFFCGCLGGGDWCSAHNRSAQFVIVFFFSFLVGQEWRWLRGLHTMGFLLI